MQIEIDSLSISDLEGRYGVNRANLYKRINSLKEKGYPMEFESRDRKSYANASQISFLDDLQGHIKSGATMNSFPAMGEDVSLNDTRQLQMSRETQDSKSAIAKSSPQSIALTSNQLIELVSAIALLPPAPLPPAPVDPLENLDAIERAYSSGWLLSSSQLAPLIGLKSLVGKDSIKKFGYTFTPAGRNGREKAWKISKEL